MRRSACTICVAAVVWLLAIATAKADDSSEEFWPEVDTCWRVSPAWRVSLSSPSREMSRPITQRGTSSRRSISRGQAESPAHDTAT